MQQIIGHYSTLFCKQEDTEMVYNSLISLLVFEFIEIELNL